MPQLDVGSGGIVHRPSEHTAALSPRMDPEPFQPSSPDMISSPEPSTPSSARLEPRDSTMYDLEPVSSPPLSPDSPMYPDRDGSPIDFVPEMAAYLHTSLGQEAHQSYDVEGRAKSSTANSSRNATPRRSPPAPDARTSALSEQPQPAAEPTFVFSNGDDDSDDASDINEAPGQAGLLEKTHGVSHREAQRPLKKLKTDHDTDSEDARRPQQQPGVVGQWLQDQRKETPPTELPSAQGPVIQTVDEDEDDIRIDSVQPAKKRNVVDLTADDGEDNEAPQLEEEKEVCYGKIDGAQAYAHTIPHPKDHAGVTNDGNTWKVLFCTVFREPVRHNVIHLRDPHQKVFATVDLRVARALAPLLDTKHLRLRVDARLDPRKRKPSDHIGRQVSEYWKLTLNLYGPKKHITLIGKALSQKNVWLSTPYGVRYGTEILNPHAADRAAITKAKWTQKVQSSGLGAGYVVRTNEEVAQDLSGIFNSLHNADDLVPLEPVPAVTTKLLDHQKRALRFMTNREIAKEERDGNETIPGNPLWRMRMLGSGRKSYYNVITGNEQPHAPDPVLGGILADQMGLGKTLEAIAFICSTLDKSKQWADQAASTPNENGVELTCLKTTLLICPKNVCSEWQDQINTHLKKDSLTYYFYHGSDRTRDIKILGKYDVVITTYSIVANELRRSKNGVKSIFAAVRWFRIVLDEAHVIREQSTQQSQAICSLTASRRWALTGTPIQNRLEDLGALIKFLRIKPFDEPAAFVQYIMTSFKMKDETALQKLHVLIDSFTLRRLKDKIDLPSREEKQILLEFSPEEAALHNWFTKDAGNKMRLMQSKKRTLTGRSYHNVLRSILCLRLVSVHGRELLHEDDLQMIQGISSEQPIDLDNLEEEPSLTARTAYEMLMLMDSAGRQVCNRCGRAVRPAEDEDDKRVSFGAMLPCYDLVCSSCVAAVRQAASDTAVDGLFSCPFCETAQKLSFFALTQAGTEEAEADREQAKLNPRQAKILGRYRGPHTKTRALLHCLKEDACDSAASQAAGGPPVKSVVFTEWTSHMDLLEIALEDHAPELGYVRFDGKMSVRQQAAALERLRSDDGVGLIMVSIRAGGVGLNLTAASRVYVMEPQWNPAAEAQAVDRVHRLGQRLPVRIVRFIMSKSIEETMVALQGKKQRLADVSLNKNVARGKVAAENMEEFRELFSRRL